MDGTIRSHPLIITNQYAESLIGQSFPRHHISQSAKRGGR